MKAGNYWVGDLCYVLGDRWDEVCDLTIKDGKTLEGVFTLSDGTEFAMYGTAYGDGQYEDREGRIYLVDSGTLGCVLLSNVDDQDNTDGGHVIQMDRDFSTCEDNGLIVFGDIEIQTSDEEEYWDDDEEDY